MNSQTWSHVDLVNFVATDKPRYLLVRLISADKFRRILRNRHVLPSLIAASSDKTTSERAYLKSLIEEMTHHNERNPEKKKKIKYVNGMQTIVNVSSRNRSQQTKNGLIKPTKAKLLKI